MCVKKNNKCHSVTHTLIPYVPQCLGKRAAALCFAGIPACNDVCGTAGPMPRAEVSPSASAVGLPLLMVLQIDVLSPTPPGCPLVGAGQGAILHGEQLGISWQGGWPPAIASHRPPHLGHSWAMPSTGTRAICGRGQEQPAAARGGPVFTAHRWSTCSRRAQMRGVWRS